MRVQLAALLLAGSALAPATVAAAPAVDWTGPYIGVNAGGDFTDIGTSGTAEVEQVSNVFWPGRGLIVVPGTTVSFPTDQFNTVTVSTHRKTGASFGGQAGYDWQFGQFVAGLEGDVQATSQSQTTTVSTTLPFTAVTPPSSVTLQRTARIDTPWSVRARVGAAWGPTLAYATGGVAGARLKASNMDTFFDPGGLGAGCGNADPATCLASLGPNGPVNLGPSGPTVTVAAFSKMRIGWTAGGGVEERLGSHLSIAVEYRHTDLGTLTYGGPQTIVSQGAVITDPHGNQPAFQANVAASLTRATLRNDAVGVRLNYRF